MLTVKEASAMLGVSESRVKELIGAKQLCAQKKGRMWLIEEREIAARLDRKPKAGRPVKAALCANVDPSQMDSDIEFHQIYLLCKEKYSHRSFLAQPEDCSNQEEASFRRAISDFFLQQRQAELIQQGVY